MGMFCWTWVSKANPTFSHEEQDRFARDKFMATAGSTQLIFWLRALKPKTLQGAIDLALQFEAASSGSLAAGPTAAAPSIAAAVQPAASPTKSELYKVLADLTSKLASLEGQMKARSSGQEGAAGDSYQSEKREGKKGPPTCFNCGQKGHVRRICPNKKPSDERPGTGAAVDKKPLN